MNTIQFDCNIKGDWFRFQDLEGSETIPRVIDELNQGEYGVGAIDLDPGDVFLDVGGNIGIVSIYMAKKFGCKVIAFEPMPENVENFKANVLLNGLSLSDFTIHQNAVSGKDGEILKIGKLDWNTGACTTFYTDNYSNIIEVKTVSLSKFITPEVKYLKMDCEGGEYEIIPTIKNKLSGLKYIGIELHQLVKSHDAFSLYSQLRESFRGKMFIDGWDEFSGDLTQRLRDFDKAHTQNKKVIAASGYFNPLHKGHVEYLEKAKTLGDKLIVIINSDHQRALKGSKEFMDENERMFIVKALSCVDEVFLSIDQDGTVCKSLAHIKPDIFAKGGDRFASEIPEAKVCDELEIIMVDGLGKKIQSSSWLLNKE